MREKNFWNALWNVKILIRNGKLFQTFAPEYMKLHSDKSNPGRGTVRLCECVLWFEWK